MKTDSAIYTQSDGIDARAGAGHVHARAHEGHGVGATYDKTRDVLWLLDQARIVVTPDDKGAGGVDIDAGAAGFARRDRYMRFERGVRSCAADRRSTRDDAVAYLATGQTNCEMIELRGNSRVSGVGTRRRAACRR